MRKIIVVLSILLSSMQFCLATESGVSAEGKTSFDLTDAEMQWLEENPAVEIAFDLEGAPYGFLNDRGEPVGVFVDLLKDLQQHVPIEIDYLPAYYAQVVASVKTADHELVTGFDHLDYPAYTESYFKSESILYMPFALFASAESDPEAFTVENMKGKRIAIIEGWSLDHPALQALGEAELVFCKNDTHGLNMVINGEVDALYEAATMVSYLLNKNMIKNIRLVQVTKYGFPLSIFVRKDYQPFFTILQRYLTSLDGQKRSRMIEKWTSGLDDPGFHLFSLGLNDQERQWLADHQVIRVAADPHWRPIDWRDKSGQQIGLSADYIRQLEKLLKTRFEYVPVNSWAEAIDRFKNGEVDVLSAVARTDRREQFIDFTEPYLELKMKIYIKEGGFINSLAELEGKRLAVPKEYAVTENIRRDYPTIQLIEFDTVEQSMEALLDGRADAFVGTILTATHVMAQRGIYQIKVSGDTPYSYLLAFGVPKQQQILGSILRKSLEMIPADDRARIYSKWAPLPPPPKDYSSIWKIGIPTVLLLFAVIGWNWMLKRQVKRRTADLRAMTEELLETADRLMEAEEIAAMGHWKLDHKTGQMICSKEMINICGLEGGEQTISFAAYEALVHPNDLESLHHDCEESIKAQTDFRNEHRILLPHGMIKSVRMQCRTIYNVDGSAQTSMGILQDITEQKRMQASILQNEKMHAIGELAGGVAHDFKNMLAGIIGASELLAEELTDQPELSEYNNMVLHAADRAAQLASKLLTFSRKREISLAVVDLHVVLEEAIGLLKQTLNPLISIERSLVAGSAVVYADSSQLQNAFINLGINASHAMEEGGTLSFKTKNRLLTPDECDDNGFALKPGNYLEIEIRDTGCGIAPEVLPRIFEPFFTTKDVDKGTGLGLSSVYGTIKQHHGSIHVFSEIKEGTAFRIMLPLADEAHRSILNNDDALILQGCGTILLVEDELVLRAIVEVTLKSFGYTVILAENGREAIEIYAKRQDEIDLVILDMVMPVMDGKECFLQIRQMNPDAKVILASGYPRPEDVQLMRDKGLKAFISKPYRRHELNQVVQDVIMQ